MQWRWLLPIALLSAAAPSQPLPHFESSILGRTAESLWSRLSPAGNAVLETFNLNNLLSLSVEDLPRNCRLVPFEGSSFGPGIKLHSYVLCANNLQDLRNKKLCVLLQNPANLTLFTEGDAYDRQTSLTAAIMRVPQLFPNTVVVMPLMRNLIVPYMELEHQLTAVEELATHLRGRYQPRGLVLGGMCQRAMVAVRFMEERPGVFDAAMVGLPSFFFHDIFNEWLNAYVCHRNLYAVLPALHHLPDLSLQQMADFPFTVQQQLQQQMTSAANAEQRFESFKKCSGVPAEMALSSVSWQAMALYLSSGLLQQWYAMQGNSTASTPGSSFLPAGNLDTPYPALNSASDIERFPTNAEAEAMFSSLHVTGHMKQYLQVLLVDYNAKDRQGHSLFLKDAKVQADRYMQLVKQQTGKDENVQLFTGRNSGMLSVPRMVLTMVSAMDKYLDSNTAGNSSVLATGVQEAPSIASLVPEQEAPSIASLVPEPTSF